MVRNATPHKVLDSVCVLVSGGLDSGVLLSQLSQRFKRIYPLYVATGARWEAAEQYWLGRLLRALGPRLGTSFIEPLRVLTLDVSDLYPPHWSLNNGPVPAAADPDESVFLPGRNLLLLSKALVFCQLQGIGNVALGILRGNPFADSRMPFFRALEQVSETGLENTIRIHTPLAESSKVSAIQSAPGMPLEWTFSCIDPEGFIHCGVCQKCGERRTAFEKAGLVDRTEYACTAEEGRVAIS
ncbi:MAG: 7-cyano-7-deazaguanine synthase [Candidatus Omnitrophica bacterium]|nr:7-cyano-7-deazaguanine synthase [Candidatus Omnitrophota bacterium]